MSRGDKVHDFVCINVVCYMFVGSTLEETFNWCKS